MIYSISSNLLGPELCFIFASNSPVFLLRTLRMSNKKFKFGEHSFLYQTLGLILMPHKNRLVWRSFPMNVNFLLQTVILDGWIAEEGFAKSLLMYPIKITMFFDIQMYSIVFMFQRGLKCRKYSWFLLQVFLAPNPTLESKKSGFSQKY